MKAFHFTSFIALLLLSHGLAKAQETVPASGGDLSGAGGSISYTLGQIAYQTYSSTSGSVAEGVQQPYEISVVLGAEVTGITLGAYVYPNPTMEWLHLVLEEPLPDEFRYRLYDLGGRTIREGAVAGKVTEFKLNDLPASTYLLTVSQQQKPIKTFKIIKK